jgi:putative nucleotidyltransferase with HDIG domain
VRLCGLPTFHSIASHVVSVASGPEADAKRIASMVGGDPALAADVLFLANSSLFGFPARIGSLRHAVAVLGLNRVRDLAAAVAMRGLVREVGPLIGPCWRHSIACATIAEEIAPALGTTPDYAFTAGLLHDIGRFGFLKSYASETALILTSEFAEPDDVIRAECNALSMDHGAAGAYLIEYWVLPAWFDEICRHHHSPADEGDSELLRTIKIACRLATALGFSSVRYQTPPTYDDVVGSLPGPFRGIAPRREQLAARVEARLQILDA